MNNFYNVYGVMFPCEEFVALYGIVYACTQRRDLSPIYGSLTVRVVLMLPPEVFAALMMIVVGVRMRYFRQTKLVC